MLDLKYQHIGKHTYYCIVDFISIDDELFNQEFQISDNKDDEND